jgi:hypothetical protein
MPESEASTLDEFAAECGTTDDPREGIEVTPPDDGHVRREHELDPFWHGEREIFNGYHHGYSLVPPGRLHIILDASGDCVERGWKVDEPLKRGVYLDGRADVGTMPPTPIEIDDIYLQFAAEAAILATQASVKQDDEVVAISGNSLSLSFAVRAHEKRLDERLIDLSDDPVVYPDEKPNELHYGYVTVRRRGTPYEVYTQAEKPRLALDDLRTEVGADGL